MLSNNCLYKELSNYIESSSTFQEFLKESQLRYTLVKPPKRLDYSSTVKKIAKILQNSRESNFDEQKILQAFSKKICREIDQSEFTPIDKKILCHALCHNILGRVKQAAFTDLMLEFTGSPNTAGEKGILLNSRVVGILYEISPFFHSLLSNGFKEKENRKVLFPEFTKVSFATLLRHLFELKPLLSEEANMVELIKLSDFLGLEFLTEYYLFRLNDQLYENPTCYSAEDLAELAALGYQAEKVFCI